jgi:hypothetical protein
LFKLEVQLLQITKHLQVTFVSVERSEWGKYSCRPLLQSQGVHKPDTRQQYADKLCQNQKQQRPVTLSISQSLHGRLNWLLISFFALSLLRFIQAPISLNSVPRVQKLNTMACQTTFNRRYTVIALKMNGLTVMKRFLSLFQLSNSHTHHKIAKDNSEPHSMSTQCHSTFSWYWKMWTYHLAQSVCSNH